MLAVKWICMEGIQCLLLGLLIAAILQPESAWPRFKGVSGVGASAPALKFVTFGASAPEVFWF